MSSRAFPRTRWPLPAAAVALAALVVVLVAGGRARAGTDCWYGAITLSSPPLLSAPNPAHPGDTITSTGGGWATCGGEPFTGFFKEWVAGGRGGRGPRWGGGGPGGFT